LKKIKKILGLIIAGTVSFSIVGCNLIQKTPEAIAKTVVAKVGDKTITLGEVDENLQSVISQLKQQYGDNYLQDSEAKSTLTAQRKEMLTQLVNQKILLKKAEDLKVVPSDADLAKAVDEQMASYQEMYGGEYQLNAAVTAAGMTMDSLRELIKENIIIQKAQEEILKGVTVTEEEAKKYYDENKASQFTQSAGATVAHILVKTEDEAKKIKLQLDSGADFATLAKNNSTDTGSAADGGSLGYIPYNSTQYVTEFMDAVKALKKDGEVSAPVKSQYGYHIIKVTGIQTEDIVKKYEDVKEEIMSSLETQKKNDLMTSTLEQLKKDYNVKTYEDRL